MPRLNLIRLELAERPDSAGRSTFSRLEIRVYFGSLQLAAYGSLQEKLAASLVEPTPLYVATCG